MNFHSTVPESGNCVTAVLRGVLVLFLCVASHDPTWGAVRFTNLRGHSDRVTQVALSPDASLAVTASWDSSVVVWKTNPSREIRRFTQHRGHVNTVAFSPSGDLVASGAADGSLFLFNARTGELRRSLTHSESVDCVAFDPKGTTLLVTYFDSRIILLSLESGQVEEIDKASYGGFGLSARCGFSSDRSIFWASGTDSIQRWSASTRKPLEELMVNRGEVMGQTILNVAGDMSIATGTDRVELRSVSTSAAPARFERKSMYGRALAASPDGTRIAVSTFNNVLILDQSGRLLRELEGHSSEIHGLQFSKDSRKLLTGSWDDTAILWDVESGERLALMEKSSNDPGLVTLADDLLIFNPTNSRSRRSGIPGGSVLLDPIRRRSMLSDWNIVAVSKDRQWAIAETRVNSASAFALFRFQEFLNEERPEFTIIVGASRRAEPRNLVSFAESIPVLAIASEKTVRIVDLQTATVSEKFDFNFPVTSVGVSADGHTLLAGLSEGTLSIIDLTGKRARFDGRAFEPRGRHHAPPYISSVGVSPKGDWAVVTSSESNSGLVIDLTRREAIDAWRGSGLGPTRFAISPDGRTIVRGEQSGLIIWNVDGKPKRHAMSLPGVARWSAIAFSQDSKRFAVSTESGVVHSINRDTLESIPMLGHDGRVKEIIFHDTRKKIWTAGEDGTARLWSSDSGQLDATMSVHPFGRWSATTPTGQFDSNRLESDAADAYWISDDAPTEPLPLEVFTRGYFTAGLLQRILDGEPFDRTPPPNGLNRTQPMVKIESVVPSSNPLLATVTVSVRPADGQVPDPRQPSGGVYDLRLFRDGQLIAQYPDDDGLFVGPIALDELERFRKTTLVAESGQTSIQFKNVQLGDSPSFSAYAFNSDRVKTTTSTFDYDAKTPKGKPKTAYVITVGVDANESGWDLSFAANSARTAEALIREQFKKSYENVVVVSLRAELGSDGTVKTATATKENIRGAMLRLGGRGSGLALDARVMSQLKDLSRAQPNDAVILYIAGHGYADPAGHFFMVPYDTGRHYDVTPETLNACLTGRRTQRCGSSHEFLARSISSADMASMWKHIDAAEKILILDACHSAAVQGPDFRPAPLGDASFGQMAFDKQITILSATQPDKTARATALTRLGHTLLVDALAHAQDGHGDQDTMEWLRRAERIAPIRSAAIYADLSIPIPPQKPMLFDLSETSFGLMLPVGAIRRLEPSASAAKPASPRKPDQNKKSAPAT